jgi:hypothetical protein
MSNCKCSCCDGCDSCCDCPKCECGDKGHDKHERDDDSSYLKFSGIVQVAGGPYTTYLGDAGPVVLTPSIPVSYPAARRGKLKSLAVNLTPPVLVPPGAVIALQLFKNNAPVSDFLVKWEAGETTGVKLAKTDELKLSKEDLFDLRLTYTGFPEGPIALVVAATIGVK